MLKDCICFMFGHKWVEGYALCCIQPKPIRRSSALNRKGGKKRTLYSKSFKIKQEKIMYCERCGKEYN